MAKDRLFWPVRLILNVFGLRGFGGAHLNGLDLLNMGILFGCNFDRINAS